MLLLLIMRPQGLCVHYKRFQFSPVVSVHYNASAVSRVVSIMRPPRFAALPCVSERPGSRLVSSLPHAMGGEDSRLASLISEAQPFCSKRHHP